MVRSPAAALMVLATALMTSVSLTTVATAAPSAGSSSGAREGVQLEYVVTYTADTASATAAIVAAGGTVDEVNDELKVVKVTSTADGFLASVRGAAGIDGAARNHSIGIATPGMPHREAQERPEGAEAAAAASAARRGGIGVRSAEPLSAYQWDMALIGVGKANTKATGKGVDVGVIDTGIDGSHPDLAPNFDVDRSRNFTTDIPAIDGPCEVPSCVDAANVDDGGHGTHVAGTIAAAANGLGIAGVAPKATLINLRAGQDSGYFFLYETVAALTAAGDMRLDVVNMSFYTDPWLFNCASRADYVSGEVSDDDLAQQAMVRTLVLKAVKYAYQRGVTLVAAAGNGHTDYAAPTRSDASSPDYPGGTETARVVTDNCLDLPNEAPQVISVSSVGPSGIKADYSDYGFGDVEVAAPGGYFRDGFGTPTYGTPGNLILSSYPLHVAIEEGLADADGNPTDAFSITDCTTAGTCGFYTYLQGTSMASPHAAGVAALIIDRFGHRSRGGGKSLAPAAVRWILERTATDTACPVGGVLDYTATGRDPSFNATCAGTTRDNGLYGEGLINAARAVGATR